jgi:hypothetical protein
MDVDGMVTDNDKINENTDAALDAFWADHRLLHRKAELSAFLGTEKLEDMNDVHPRDLKTVHFTQWAEGTLTIAETNRLRRAVQGYHAKHNPRGDTHWQHGPNGQHANRGGSQAQRTG